MSNFGQIALTVVGTVGGAVIGGPAGAEIGFSAGSILGNLIFPTRRGPTTQDGHITGASEGSAIAYAIGNCRIAGQVISNGPFVESSGSGKGLPGTGATTHYYVSFRMRICDNRDGKKVGIRRIWCDRVLVYDVSESASEAVIASSLQFAHQFTVYLGAEDQVVDATEEAIYGAGNVSARRGYLDVMFHGFDATAYGARIPNIEFEVIEGVVPPPAALPLAGNVLYPWVDSATDPRNCKNDHEYLYVSRTGVSSGWLSSESAAKAAVAADYGFSPAQIIGWARLSNTSIVSPFEAVAHSEDIVLVFHWAMYAPIRLLGILSSPVSSYRVCGQFNANSSEIPIDQNFFWYGVYNAGSGNVYTEVPALYWIDPSHSATPPPGYAAISNCIDSPPTYDEPIISGGCTVWQLPTVQIQVRRAPRGPDNPCSPRCESAYPLLPFSTDYCVISGGLVPNRGYSIVGSQSTSAPFAYRWLADYTDSTGDTDRSQAAGIPVGTVEYYPASPALAIGDPLDGSAYWGAQYALAVAAGTVPAGLTYAAGNNLDPTKYPITKTYAWLRIPPNSSVRPEPVTVADAITRICALAGINSADIDISSVTSTMWGYAMTRAGMSGRDCLAPLMQYGFLDGAETGGLLRFVQRGGAVAATLTEDDLGAFEAGSGNHAESRLQVLRANDLDLPRTIRVKFADIENSYLDGLQLAQRLVDTSQAQQDVDLGIAMTPTQARVVAETLLRVAWLGRETFPKIAVSSDYLEALTPGAAFDLVVAGDTRRGIVKTVDYQFPGLLTITAQRDEAGLYETLAATGDVTTGASFSAPTIVPPSTLVVLDLPALQNGDEIDAGVYVAVYCVLTPWSGAGVFESKDGGANYVQRASVSTAAAVGTIRAGLPTGSETVLDTTITLTVDQLTGTLAGVSDAALAAFQNAFAIGAPGRWTIIQARDITLNMDGSYTLTGFLQGLKGTAANRGTSVAGDQIVQLDSRLRRVHESVSEIGQTRLLRAVTAGTAVSDAADVSFTVTGLSYVPPLTGTPSTGGIVVGAPAGSTSGSPTTTIPSVGAGAVLIDQGAGVSPTFEVMSGDATISAGGALELAASGVTAGVYFSASMTLDAKGRATAATDLHGLTEKTAPVDADEMPLADSAAGYAGKKLSIANFKALLATYFNGLYSAIGAITGSGLTMATGKLLGRSSSSTGPVEEITVGSGLTLSGGILSGAGAAVTGQLGASFSNNGNLLVAGDANIVYFRAPRTGTISRWSISGDASGSASFDVFKDTSYPPALSITAAVQPMVSSAAAVTSTTLTGWTTSVTAGDWVGVKLLSSSGFRFLTLQLDYA